MKKILIAGAIFMALAVLLGAFGAHALKARLSVDSLATYRTGVEYHFYHALGLLLIGLIGYHVHSKWLNWSAILLITGIMLFSGSLYILAITEIRSIGFITPIGGLAFVAGWLSLAMAFRKQ